MRSGQLLALMVVPALLLGVPGAARADRVYLRDGRILEGTVIDQGENLLVRIGPHGGVVVLRRDVVRVEATPGAPRAPLEGAAGELGDPSAAAQPNQPSDDLDEVILRTGHRLRGVVRFVDDRIEISSPGGRSTTYYSRGEVLRIQWHGRAEPEQLSAPAEPSGEGAAQGMAGVPENLEVIDPALIARLDALLVELRSADGARSDQARRELLALGPFAIPYLERRLREAGDSGDALIDEILRMTRIAPLVTAEMQAVAEVERRLVAHDAAERRRAVEEVVLTASEASPPLLRWLDEHDPDASVRGLCVAQLEALRCYDQLLDVLNLQDPRVRLAAAIALAGGRILAGVPVLIEALELPEPEVRALAARTLRQATGETFGYDPDAPEGEPTRSDEARLAAVARWRDWWRQSGADVIQRTLPLARNRQAVRPAQRNEALARWRDANRVLDELAQLEAQGRSRRTGSTRDQAEAARRASETERVFKLEQAVYLFRRALEADPTFAAARIGLAVVLYEEMGRLQEARQELELVLSRYVEDDALIARKVALYHLGRVATLAADYQEADVKLQQALLEDPDFIDAHVARGELQFIQATAPAREGSVLGARERELLMRVAIERYRDGIAAIDSQRGVLRDIAHDVVEGGAAERTQSEATVLASVRQNLRALDVREADIRYRIGRIHQTLAVAATSQDARTQHMELASQHYRAALAGLPPGPESDGQRRLYTDALERVPAVAALPLRVAGSSPQPPRPSSRTVDAGPAGAPPQPTETPERAPAPPAPD